ncbi:hypothetical protein [Mesorhizobium sp. ANAO-SY3R2]|uniref:hypothetical protein n=1 Tax=Mesorhizobium sp. ANAO-SY3R2 TaxID=3166644 RepID=UPI0036734939
MRRLRNLVQAARDLAGDASGNFAILGGLTVSMLAMAAGFGINIAQLYNVKSGLKHAVDAAVTSTARDLTTGKIKAEDADTMVRAFLEANAARLLAPGEKVVLRNVFVDRLAGTVEATADIDVNVYFPLFGTANRQRVTATTASLYSNKKIEVAMMLDVTGSMKATKKTDKIGDLKKAAQNAVDQLLGGQDAANPRVRVSLVPYANSINVGALAQSTVFVEQKGSERKQAPGMYDSKLASASPRPDNCATERKGNEQYTDAGPDIAMVNRDYLLTKYAQENSTTTCPAATLMPLTADSAALKASIKSYVASGGTAGHIGIQWAWYTLSENWGQVMKASERPAKADPKDVTKVAILMTDGEFNLSYFDASTSDEVYNDNGKQAPRTAATTLCKAMRNKGIEIFTVGFQLDNAAAKQTMKDCASPGSGSMKRYFEAATGAELDEAFQAIARNIEQLALTQ